MKLKPNLTYYDIEISIKGKRGFAADCNYMISMAYAFNDGKVKVLSLADYPKTFKNNPWDDSKLCEDIYSVFEESDHVVAHYGDKFDRKFVETRLLLNALPTTTGIKQSDTWKIAHRHLKLSNYRLDTLARVLGVGCKSYHEEKWWDWAMQGKVEGVKLIAKYNKHDVDPLLRGVYKKLLRYDNTGPDLTQLYFDKTMDSDRFMCPKCYSTNTIKKNFRYLYTKTAMYQRWRCKDCEFIGRARERLILTPNNFRM